MISLLYVVFIVEYESDFFGSARMVAITGPFYGGKNITLTYKNKMEAENVLWALNKKTRYCIIFIFYKQFILSEVNQLQLKLEKKITLLIFNLFSHPLSLIHLCQAGSGPEVVQKCTVAVQLWTPKILACMNRLVVWELNAGLQTSLLGEISSKFV